MHLAAHLLARYAHLDKVYVTVELLRWARIRTGAGPASGEAAGHKHAFWRDGAEKRFVDVEMARKSDGNDAVARVAGGLKDLLGTFCRSTAFGGFFLYWLDDDDDVVLKTTGSAFESFVRDEYTTLAEVKDRIFSTSVDLRYTYVEVDLRLPRDEKRLDFGEQNLNENEGGQVYTWEDAKVGALAREITLDVFANDESASVQVRGNGGGKQPPFLQFAFTV
jgi:urate oxidase